MQLQKLPQIIRKIREREREKNGLLRVFDYFFINEQKSKKRIKNK